MAKPSSTLVDRSFPRLSRQGKIKFEVIEDPQRKLVAAGLPEGQFQNICGGGVRFHGTHPVDPGCYLAVRIELADLPDSILALGRVVACEPPADTDQHWDLSVEFLWTGWGTAERDSLFHRLLREHV
ncbi:MAG: hypothetical protein JXQ29_07620 [Planctomycetes bacterium]|nr:hypothetical protein [Planctomycetota bacterium]